MTVLSSKAKDTQKNYKRFIMAFIEKYKHRGFQSPSIWGVGKYAYYYYYC